MESQLETAFNHKASDFKTRELHLQKELRQCEVGIENLVDRMAEGIISDAILKKLKELEAKKSEVQREIAECEAEATRTVEITDLAEKIRKFSERIEEMFEAGDIEGKKELMKIWIREIIVDRDNGLLRVYVRTIPALVPGVEEEMAKKKGTHNVVSTQSSGDPLQSLPTKNVENLLVFAEMTF